MPVSPGARSTPLPNGCLRHLARTASTTCSRKCGSGSPANVAATAPRRPFVPGWFTIARNLAIDLVRRHRPLLASELQNAEDDGDPLERIADERRPSADEALDGKRMNARLHEALASLPAVQREAILAARIRRALGRGDRPNHRRQCRDRQEPAALCAGQAAQPVDAAQGVAIMSERRFDDSARARGRTGPSRGLAGRHAAGAGCGARRTRMRAAVEVELAAGAGCLAPTGATVIRPARWQRLRVPLALAATVLLSFGAIR